MKLLRTLAALAITVCVALLLAVLAGYGSAQRVVDQGRLVAPAEVFEPFGWQANVRDDPAGPATVLVSGDGWGMRGVTYRGKVAVVAETGVYRTLRYKVDVQAGEDVLLSPDGTAVADALPHPVARASGSPSPDPVSTDPAIWITELSTGKSTRLAIRGSGAARPVAWSSDGEKLLVHVAAAPEHGPWTGGDLNLLDLATGTVSRLADLGAVPVHRAHLAAFSPDGRSVVVQVGDALRIVDTASRSARTLANLGPDRRLAGIGAWSADGSRIAVLTLSGCTKLCTRDALDDRTWQVDEINATSGAPLTGGFDRLTGSAVRVLGRSDSGELAVVRYRAGEDLSSDGAGTLRVDGDEVEETDYRAVGDAELIGLGPTGDRRTLVTLPSGARHVDVAANLVAADRFDGRSPRPMPWPAPFWVNAAVVVVLVLAIWLVLRVRRLGA
ncbi:TolB family protein [Cryptosporangium minutisporangium]|uniref:WD40 repeat domain-containing protein n=1 Tax=Cryptosporangium minutisporangium TaxID=113569 RepID=A0ABP6SVE2_9ACTN